MKVFGDMVNWLKVVKQVVVNNVLQYCYRREKNG